MVNKLIDVYLAWHFSRPKWARVLLKAIGAIIFWGTCWIWLPAIFIVWLVVKVVLDAIEFVKKA